MEKILIVGAVGGGATAAGQLRFYNKDAVIKIFDRDSVMSYAACGTPYAIGEVIEDEETLLMADPEQFKEKRNIEVYLRHEVMGIDREKKNIQVKNLMSGEEFLESYDKLILSPGGTAVVPAIKGSDTADIFSLRSYNDMLAIKQYIESHNPQSCTISGGGFIGLEMAENIKELGIDVHLVHKSDYIMSILDEDISREIEKELLLNEVHLQTNAYITEIDGRSQTLSNGGVLETDFIIMSVGLAPNVSLAKDAELEIGETGGIVTNDYMQTNDPDIYAIGDASENFDLVTGEPKRVPLAWPAHRQAYIVAKHIIGEPIAKKGLLGTSIVKIFSLTAAMTGLNENKLRELEIPSVSLIHNGNSNAGYYPDHGKLKLKIHYDPNTREIFGAQCLGTKGVDKRIDVIATAMYAGLTVDDLQALELCYAPPYSSPKDPVNMAGYKADKK
ncbi:CoA-disulfide reductase [Planococcus halotolerans]|uniref:CoA-disulfide reductase n=1 Tax=Planococcus halotolerans TaxID=2233542 RepID=UPI001091A110|nr:CoA-disulfide reductase [Planococcus halotolerans]QHJ70736.1 CoA-disulfide reductase [Planococcus halotolerans]